MSPEEIQKTFQSILDKLHEIHPQPEKFHLPPVKSSEIEFRERKVGIKLPNELKALYQVCGGQMYDMETVPIFYDMALLPLDEAIKSARYALSHSIQEGDEMDWRESVPVGMLKETALRPDWYSFCRDGAGGQLRLDYEPAEKGYLGQINVQGHHDTNYCLATSMLNFLNWYLRQLYEGKYILGDPDNQGRIGIYAEGDGKGGAFWFCITLHDAPLPFPKLF